MDPTEEAGVEPTNEVNPDHPGKDRPSMLLRANAMKPVTPEAISTFA
jgi:hypothetical protein